CVISMLRVTLSIFLSCFFFSSRRRHTRSTRDWSSDVCSSDLFGFGLQAIEASVGIGVGLLFLAREGLSFAMLRVMPSAEQAEMRSEERRVGKECRARRAT